MRVGTVGTARPVVLRANGALLVPGVVWVFCFLAVVDSVVEGSLGLALRTTVLMSAIAFGAWMGLASPCLAVGHDGLRIVNPLRIHAIPFGALDSVRVRGLTVVTARVASGRLRSVTSWNAPGVPRRFTPATAPVATLIERFRSEWEHGSAARVTSVATASWRARPAMLLVVLLTVNIAVWWR